MIINRSITVVRVSISAPESSRHLTNSALLKRAAISNGVKRAYNSSQSEADLIYANLCHYYVNI